MLNGTQPTTNDDMPAELGNQRKRCSIDLSLELEHQLNMDSQPPTPSHDSHDVENGNSKDRASLDPHVLQHLVTQLQNSLEGVTRERDQLHQMLSEVQSSEAGLKEKVKGLETELEQAQNKMKDDEDSIAMLRTKVEESRRGLMRLQTESRRNSAVPSPLDLSRAGIPSFTSPPSSKRASFAPLTGSSFTSGHRRIASVSDTGDSFTSHPPGHSRRISGIFGLGSPPHPPHLDLLDPHVLEVEALKKEVEKLKEALDQARHEATEANEAKEASETCAKVLREFIAENTIGVNSPDAPLPLQRRGSSPERPSGGWGFKLWKTPEAPSRANSVNYSPPATQASPQAPLSKKIGGFFSSRAGSVSSTSPDQRDSLYSSSDTSSVAEPISPPGDINGNIMVRDVASLSDMGSGAVVPDVSKNLLTSEPRASFASN